MATARPRHSRRHNNSLVSEQERLARKREQNRIAQQVYRRAQKERIQALEAAVAKSSSSGGGPWTQFDDVPGEDLFFSDGPAGTPSLSSATSAVDSRGYTAGLFEASLDPSLDHSLNQNLGDGHIGGPGDVFGDYVQHDSHTTTASLAVTVNTSANTDTAKTCSFTFAPQGQQPYEAASAPGLMFGSIQADDMSILDSSPASDDAAAAMSSTPTSLGAAGQKQPDIPRPTGTAPESERRHGRQTALHIAASHGSSGMVKLLLGRGADAGPMDEDGRTPLHLAVIATAEAARRSKSSSSSSSGCSSADDSSDSDGGGSGGMGGGDHGGEAVEAETALRLLLRARAAGANPRALDKSGRSVLFTAVATGCQAAVRIVLDAMGSEGPAESSSSPGSRPFSGSGSRSGPTLPSKEVASEVGWAGIRAALNEPDAQGTLPLHLAVASGSASMVLLLLSNGADING